MPPVRTRALILHTFAYGDTSRILRLLTPEYGLRSVIAKGARTPKNRFGGVLEPFTEGEAQFTLREGRELFTLSGFSLIRGRQAIGRDFGSFTGASVIAEVALRFSTEDPLPEVFHLVTHALDRLTLADGDPLATSLATLWSLVSRFGYQPEMESCVRCGRALDAREPAGFDAEGGGAVCLHCPPPGPLLPASVRREIGSMSDATDIHPILHQRQLHGHLLQAFLSAHLFHGPPLRSLPFFLQQLR